MYEHIAIQKACALREHYDTVSGEGFSGLFPGLLGLAQGVGGEPDCQNQTQVVGNETEHVIVAVYPPARFSVEVFFFCMFLLILVSAAAFSLLHFARFAQREKLAKASYCIETIVTSEKAGGTPEGTYVNQAYTHDTMNANQDTDDSFEKKSTKNHAMKNKAETQSEKVTSHSNVFVVTSSADAAVGPSTALRSDPKRVVDYLSTSDSSSDETSCSKVVTSSSEAVTSENNLKTTDSSAAMGVAEYAVLLVFLALVNSMTNGVLPSTLTYSTIPYSNTTTMHQNMTHTNYKSA